MNPEDIKEGCYYRAKRPQANSYDADGPIMNDRKVLRVTGGINGRVQYDGPAVPADGRHYPRVTMEAFLKWAGCEIPREQYTRKGEVVK